METIDARVRKIKDDLRFVARRALALGDKPTEDLMSTHIEILHDYDQWWVWYELYPPVSYLAYVEQMLTAASVASVASESEAV